MITQKKMIIPIFNYKLTVVIFDKWEELERFLPKEEMEHLLWLSIPKEEVVLSMKLSI